MWDIVSLGIGLIILGFGIVATALLMSGQPKGSGAKGGGVVMIGPIPLIFASDSKWASIAITLAIILVLLSLFLYVW